jgi:hypothetical protein
VITGACLMVLGAKIQNLEFLEACGSQREGNIHA